MSVTLDWYGCATFRLQTAGLKIFLDAYIDRASGAAGTGLRADDIDEADWILVGHSHFDHLYGAERIAANTGARIIASYYHYAGFDDEDISVVDVSHDGWAGQRDPMIGVQAIHLLKTYLDGNMFGISSAIIPA